MRFPGVITLIVAAGFVAGSLGQLGTISVATASDGIVVTPGVEAIITDAAGPLNEIVVGADTTMQVQDEQFSPNTGPSGCVDSSDITMNVCGEVFPSDSLTGTGTEAGGDCSADAGIWVGIGATEYGPDMSNGTIHCQGTATSSLSPDVNFTPISQVGSGTGTHLDPYTVVTTVELTATLDLVQTIRYQVGSNSIGQSIELVSTGSKVVANIYHGVDIYLAENDNGFVYDVPKTGNPSSNGVNFQVGGVNAVDTTPGPFHGDPADGCSPPAAAPSTDSVGPGNFHEFLAPDASADHFVEDNFDTVWGDIDNAVHGSTTLPDTTLSSSTCDDNGVAVEWDSVGSGTVVNDNIAFGPSTSTPAYVSRFSVKQIGRTATFRWRTTMAKLLAGFYLYSGSHRLNEKMISVHVSSEYVERRRSSGRGEFELHVVLRDGSQVVVKQT